MTELEAKHILKRIMNNNFYGGEVQTACKMGIKALSKPELPSDLDEAARHYLLNEHCSPLNEIMHQADLKAEMTYHKDIESSFKAGAEWMAGQGYTDEVKNSDLEDRKYVFVPYEEFNTGDKVVVHIRKKQ